MQDKYIQALRYKLQKRVRRLNSVPYNLFPHELKQFFAFFDAMPLLCSVRDELLAAVTEGRLEHLMSQFDDEEGVAVMGNTEAEQAALGYRILKRFEGFGDEFDPFVLGRRYGRADNVSEAFDRCREVFLEPFYEYVDEHIDDQQAVLYFLRKYKHRCEWFRRDELRELACNDTVRAEHSLAYDLYEYLHDQGIDFNIEPRSASGRPDLLAEQVGEDKVVADAKLFWPERSKDKSYLCTGFNQVYTYARDYNETFAYLVIFKLCEDDLRFALPATSGLFPSLSHNNKTIFLVTVDLCDYGTTASGRGKLKVYEISADDLIRVIENPSQDTS